MTEKSSIPKNKSNDTLKSQLHYNEVLKCMLKIIPIVKN